MAEAIHGNNPALERAVNHRLPGENNPPGLFDSIFCDALHVIRVFLMSHAKVSFASSKRALPKLHASWARREGGSA
ncbi:hypothetical protein, partial [Pseudomonas aeruginosa]|uniref:hypothetical protein n=1 Tax=Pseudomonas aeruginosa TaxID=287 RepID=UPI001ABC74F3